MNEKEMIMLCVGKICLMVSKDQWRDFMKQQDLSDNLIDQIEDFAFPSQVVNGSYPDELHTPKE